MPRWFCTVARVLGQPVPQVFPNFLQAGWECFRVKALKLFLRVQILLSGVSFEFKGDCRKVGK